MDIYNNIIKNKNNNIITEYESSHFLSCRVTYMYRNPVKFFTVICKKTSNVLNIEI